MGNLIIEQIVSADGFAASPDGGLDWFAVPGVDPSESDRDQLEMLESVDAILLGANTYRMFSSFWPNVTEDEQVVSGHINRLPKHVLSTTLDSAPWGAYDPATIESGAPVEVANRVRADYSGDVILWGSLKFADALIASGAVDILRLRIVPVLIGAGVPLAPSARVLPLQLESSVSLPSGHVTNTYRLR